ncbi:hypothetical protein V8G61_03070 [Gaetbulibacter sp. M240]|uniref:hypothetical protein n=1 Tax=Gaetbulibacter sp. M240 TaxID=3126511 RepID=UPI00374E87E7
MKNIVYVLGIMIVSFSCSSSRMIDSWKSPSYTNFSPKKVLIIGVTDNLTARQKFESQLQAALRDRGIEARESFDVFAPSFTNTKQTEETIEKEIEKLSNNGFDAVLISAVKGVNEKTTYTGDWHFQNYYWPRFGRYYYFYQDVYFDRGYYDKYKVYNIECTLYNLKDSNKKSLVWVASYNLIDPSSITSSVNTYVKAIIKAMENEGLINKLYY